MGRYGGEKMRRNDFVKDYGKYRPDASEITLWLAISGGISLAAGYVFYHSLLGAVSAVVIVPFFFKYMLSRSVQKRKNGILEQFRVFIGMISNSIQISAKPLDTAFFEALEEMRYLYSEKDPMVREMTLIETTVRNNNSKCIEEEFYRFAKRTGIDDIIDFAEILLSCRSTNISAISEVINTTSEVISDKLDVVNEARESIAEQRNEFLLMMCMPVGFILLFNFVMKELFSVYYTSALGRVVMTITLVINMLCIYFGLKISEGGTIKC